MNTASGGWRLHPHVSLRPERFGALAYHFDNRRLNFVRDPTLVRVLEQLERYPSVEDALAGEGVGPERRAAFVAAIDRLIASDFVIERQKP